MRYSEKTEDLFSALAEFQGQLTPPPKTRTVTVTHKSGGQHSFAYAELGTIWTHIAEPYKKCGFFWISDVVYTEKGHANLVTRIGVRSGQWMESDFPLPSVSDTKQFAGEISYARRYSFSMMLGISSQEDADEIPGSNRNPDRRERPPQQQRPPQANRPPETKGPAIQAKAPLAAANPDPASQTGPNPPQVVHPGRKEREHLLEVAEIKKWPPEQVAVYIKNSYGLSRVEFLTMEQYAEVLKVVGGEISWQEVIGMTKPQPGSFAAESSGHIHAPVANEKETA